jgi:hypothetical protein
MEPAEVDKGVPLAPSAKDLKPWYSEKSHERNQEVAEEKRYHDTCHYDNPDRYALTGNAILHINL